MQYGAQILYIQSNNAYGAYAQANEELGNSLSVGLHDFPIGNLFEFQAAVDPKGALPCVRDPYTGALTPVPGCQITLPAVPRIRTQQPLPRLGRLRTGCMAGFAKIHLQLWRAL